MARERDAGGSSRGNGVFRGGEKSDAARHAVCRSPLRDGVWNEVRIPPPLLHLFLVLLKLLFCRRFVTAAIPTPPPISLQFVSFLPLSSSVSSFAAYKRFRLIVTAEHSSTSSSFPSSLPSVCPSPPPLTPTLHCPPFSSLRYLLSFPVSFYPLSNHILFCPPPFKSGSY